MTMKFAIVYDCVTYISFNINVHLCACHIIYDLWNTPHIDLRNAPV